MSRNLHTHITSLLNSAALRAPTASASPAPWGGSGRGFPPRQPTRPTGEGRGGASQFFLNTEDTDFTEYHSAHFDETDAASRQLNSRNLRTRLISLLNSAALRAPTASASPAPWGGSGRGSPRQPHPPPPGRVGEGLSPSPTGEGRGGALTRPLGRAGEGPPTAPAKICGICER